MRNLKTYESFAQKEASDRLDEFYDVKIDDNGTDYNRWTAEVSIPEITVYSSDYDWVMEELEGEKQTPMEFTFDRICHSVSSYIDSAVDSILENAGEDKRDFIDAWEYLSEEEKDKWYKRCEGRNPMLKKITTARGKVI